MATKGGVAWETDPAFRIWREASGDYLRMACDRSLQALGLDHIDLYQVHWPVAGVPAEDTIGGLLDLRDAGKIRAIGVSNYVLADLQAAGGRRPHRLLPARLPRDPARHRGRRAGVVRRARRRA